MDRKRFDALTRLLAAEGSRRTALGAALSATFLGNGLSAWAKKKNKKKKKKPQTCFGRKDCEFPSDSKDFENCDFSGIELSDCNGCNFRKADLGGADLSNDSLQGASFREANLRGASLEDADVSGASFRDACLVDANFFGANTDGAIFGGAILCNTTLSDGTVDDSGCDKTTKCCRTGASAECIKDADCPGQETCVDGVCTIPNPTCAVDPDACSDGFVVCGGTGGAGTCFCYVTTEGDSRCLNINQTTNPFCAGTPCNSSDDCDPGEFCASLHSDDLICCTAKICGSECPEFGATARGNEVEVTPPQP
jgi:hypothetical protein